MYQVAVVIVTLLFCYNTNLCVKSEKNASIGHMRVTLCHDLYRPLMKMPFMGLWKRYDLN